jgi:uncharacterized protein (DUF433 family)
MSRLDRITTEPSICHGRPTIRGLRYPVENLLELLASGMTIEEVLEDHPDLERDDLLAALEFAALGGCRTNLDYRARVSRGWRSLRYGAQLRCGGP